MNVSEAIFSRRTIRKFKSEPVSYKNILKIIDAGRMAPTAANLQPLKFSIITDKTIRLKMFPHIKYAGYIPEWNPTFEESPTAFIAILNDTQIKSTDKSECDSGAAIMNMCLQSLELGIGSCWIGSFNKSEIRKILNLDSRFDITYLLGLGYADQNATAFEMTDSIKYYHDENQNVFVPKRNIKEVII